MPKRKEENFHFRPRSTHAHRTSRDFRKKGGKILNRHSPKKIRASLLLNVPSDVTDEAKLPLKDSFKKTQIFFRDAVTCDHLTLKQICSAEGNDKIVQIRLRKHLYNEKSRGIFSSLLYIS